MELYYFTAFAKKDQPDRAEAAAAYNHRPATALPPPCHHPATALPPPCHHHADRASRLGGPFALDIRHTHTSLRVLRYIIRGMNSDILFRGKEGRRWLGTVVARNKHLFD